MSTSSTSSSSSPTSTSSTSSSSAYYSAISSSSTSSTSTSNNPTRSTMTSGNPMSTSSIYSSSPTSTSSTYSNSTTSTSSTYSSSTYLGYYSAISSSRDDSAVQWISDMIGEVGCDAESHVVNVRRKRPKIGTAVAACCGQNSKTFAHGGACTISNGEYSVSVLDKRGTGAFVLVVISLDMTPSGTTADDKFIVGTIMSVSLGAKWVQNRAVPIILKIEGLEPRNWSCAVWFPLV
eukprot:3325594-Amphidinium_carterae.1